MKLRLAAPSVLVDIGRLRDLSYVRDDGDHVAIGALTRHQDVEISDVLRTAGARSWPTSPARWATRRSATGAPSEDRSRTATRPRTCPAACWPWAPPSGGRAPAASGPFPPPTSSSGFLETALQPDELLTEIRVPKMDGAGWSFQKFNRRAQDWAIVGVAAVAATARPGIGPGQHGLGAAAGDRGRGGAGRRGVGRRGGRPRRRRARPARRTSTPAPSTAATWRRSWCAGPSRRRWP